MKSRELLPYLQDYADRMEESLKADERLDKLFDTLKQVYYLNSINK